MKFQIKHIEVLWTSVRQKKSLSCAKKRSELEGFVGFHRVQRGPTRPRHVGSANLRRQNLSKRKEGGYVSCKLSRSGFPVAQLYDANYNFGKTDQSSKSENPR